MSRQDQFTCRVYVQFNGDRGYTDLGVFSQRDGGAMDSDSTKYRPGGMAPQESLGGIKDLQNVTVSRRFRHDRDISLLKRCYADAGVAPIRIVETPLSKTGAVEGDPFTWTGTVKRCSPPPRNSNSQDVALWEIECDSEGFS